MVGRKPCDSDISFMSGRRGHLPTTENIERVEPFKDSAFFSLSSFWLTPDGILLST
ncbi:MAG: hypothetical protein GXO93_02960 [FCB group bacterium]|nr:hypothetical protein [FCB group bacterium]